MRSTEYAGTANIIATIPAILPVSSMTRNISKGWAFTLLE
jgi:hypothetical protein